MSAFNSPESLQLNPNSIQLTQYVTVQAAAEVTSYNVQYLRRLLRAGKLAGIIVGQVWLISLASLSVYIQQTEKAADRRSGPKKTRISEMYTNVYDPSLHIYIGIQAGGKP